MRTFAQWLCVLALMAASVALVAPGSAGAVDRDCSDFNTQEQAQNYFEGKGGGPNNNVDRLDSDGDGRACESLPCPCAGDGQPDRPQRIHARVTKVTDGDTL